MSREKKILTLTNTLACKVPWGRFSTSDLDRLIPWAQGSGGEEFERFLNGAVRQLLRQSPPESALEPPLDFMVRVDRTLRPPYPIWSEPTVHPDLECTGPAEYDLQSDVEQWLHDDQKTGGVKGSVIYQYLNDDLILANQLGLADLLAIQKMGIQIFLELFRNKTVFGWKSVVRRRDSPDLYVPYLHQCNDEVMLKWAKLDESWYSFGSALRFRVPTQTGK